MPASEDLSATIGGTPTGRRAVASCWALASSAVVQMLVSRLLTRELGFREERLVPSEIGFSTCARPDFVNSIEPGRGILAEMERGGTTTNNHDLKDMWKAHIAPNAQHLFLIVPHANWNALVVHESIRSIESWVASGRSSVTHDGKWRS